MVARFIYTPAIVATIKRLNGDGYSDNRIARVIGGGINRGQVRSVLRRLNSGGSVGLLRPWTPAEIATALRLRSEGKTLAAIGVALDRSEAAIARQFRALGKEGKVRLKPYHPPVTVAPARCATPDALHLALIARANNGKGFPFFDLRPAYRVAA